MSNCNEPPRSGVARLYLKPGRDRSLRRRHPWIFSGSIDRVDGPPDAHHVDVFSAEGAWLGRGFWNPNAELSVRILTWQREQPIDAAYVRSLLDRALQRRERWWAANPGERNQTDAWRLIFSEADGLSGLIVDQYADVLVVKVGAAGWVAFLPDLLPHLRTRTGAHHVRVSVEPDVSRREGIDTEAVQRWSDPLPGPVRIREKGLLFEADPVTGQKTGFFLDQRENRARVARFAAGRRVLSLYCYTGAFEVHAARAGAASIVGVDVSAPALERARRHHELNGNACPIEYLRDEVPEALRRFRQEGRTFDLIIVDPPRLVWSRDRMEEGLRAYKDVNRLAMMLLTPGGILASFSCSGLVSLPDFLTVLGWAGVDSGRDVRIIEVLGQPFDHPILATVPESAYLKGVIAQVE